MSNPSGGQLGVAAGIDTIQSSGDGRTFAGGSVGQKLLANNFEIDCLRPCAEVNSDGVSVHGTLLKDEWILMDNTVQDIARERLPVVTDVIQRGLTMQLPNALGVMSLEWERVKNDLLDAEITMSGLPEATKDRQEFELVNMPIPIFHKEFFLNLRHLQAARRNGRNPDTAHAEVATRKIAELIESTFFNGIANIGGGQIYGLTSHPARATGSVTANWTTATGEQILGDLLAMKDELYNTQNFEGPYVLYVPKSVGNRLDEDFKANSDKTIRQRLLEVEDIQTIMSTSRLTGTNIVLAQTTSDVMQMIDGIQPTMVEWESHGGFQMNFKIMAIMLPRIRSDGLGQTGIVQYS